MEKDKTAATAKGNDKETHSEATGGLIPSSHSTGTSLTRFLICMAPVMVSLPGSNESSFEQPAILRVLSPINATEEKEHSKPSLKQPQSTDDINENPVNVTQSSEDFILHNDNVNDDANFSPKNLVSSSNTETDHIVKTDTCPIILQTDVNSPTTSTKDCKTETYLEDTKKKEQHKENLAPQSPSIKDHILDIESHLIETLNETSPNKESVGINELQPVENELQVGCSKVETNENVRSVIEVEPAEAIRKQPIEKFIEIDDPLQATGGYLNGDLPVNKEEIEKAAQELLQDIEEEIVKAFETNSYKGTNLQKTEENTEQTTERNRTPTNSSQFADDAEKSSEDQLDGAQSRTESQLSHVVDQQISEVTSILDSQIKEKTASLKPPSANNSLKLVSVPASQTASEEAERKEFIDSLPPLQSAETSDAEQLALDCKREYYQSLKKYLVQPKKSHPPVPLQTYRWEDLRRARDRGGYPWTHLYKRPLGPDEEPEIVLMLRKSQEIRFMSESPKSNKKVRIDDQVLIQETHPYLQELSEEEEEDEGHHSEHNLPTQDHENHSLHSDSFSWVSDSVLATVKSKAANRYNKVRRLFRRRRFGSRSNEDAQSLPDSFTNTSVQKNLDTVPQAQNIQPIYEHPKSPRCFPIMKKLKSMADRQKKRLNIKRIHLVKDDKVAPVPDEEPRIIKLKSSPKSQRSDIPHFIEKQDSDDVLEIMELDESPSRKRFGRQENEEVEPNSSIVKPEEIIEINNVPNVTEDEIQADVVDEAVKPPQKAPRLRREHVYEEIDHPDDPAVAAAEELKFILDATSVDALKQSLATQDSSAVKEVASAKNIPLDRMGSSEEETIAITDRATPERKSNNLLAPISSIDSASSDEDRSKPQLQPVTEEDQDEEEIEETVERSTLLNVNTQKEQLLQDADARSAMKKEASPAPSEKKVTFSHVEDEAEPHREDIELSAEQLEAAKEANKWKNVSKKFKTNNTFRIILMKLLLTLRYRKSKRKHRPNRWLCQLCLCLTPSCCSTSSSNSR